MKYRTLRERIELLLDHLLSGQLSVIFFAFFKIACPRAPLAIPETIRFDALRDAPAPPFPPTNIIEDAISITLITTSNSMRVKPRLDAYFFMYLMSYNY